MQTTEAPSCTARIAAGIAARACAENREIAFDSHIALTLAEAAEALRFGPT